jgi:hypothetical protein
MILDLRRWTPRAVPVPLGKAGAVCAILLASPVLPSPVLASPVLPSPASAERAIVAPDQLPAVHPAEIPDRPTASGPAQIQVADGSPRPPGPLATPEWHWRLAGTVLGPDQRQAVFAQTGETQAIAEGEQLDGWTLAAIRPGGVTLVAAGVARTLSMEGFSAEEQAAAAQLRAEAIERRNATVRANLATQEHEIEAANTALAAATRRMQGQ